MGIYAICNIYMGIYRLYVISAWEAEDGIALTLMSA